MSEDGNRFGWTRDRLKLRPKLIKMDLSYQKHVPILNLKVKLKILGHFSNISHSETCLPVHDLLNKSPVLGYFKNPFKNLFCVFTLVVLFSLLRGRNRKIFSYKLVDMALDHVVRVINDLL